MEEVTVEEQIEAVRDSFAQGEFRLNAFTRDLIISAVETRIKELVLLHDYRGKLRGTQRREEKQAAEGGIRVYAELKRQVEGLPVR